MDKDFMALTLKFVQEKFPDEVQNIGDPSMDAYQKIYSYFMSQHWDQKTCYELTEALYKAQKGGNRYSNYESCRRSILRKNKSEKKLIDVPVFDNMKT